MNAAVISPAGLHAWHAEFSIDVWRPAAVGPLTTRVWWGWWSLDNVALCYHSYHRFLFCLLRDYSIFGRQWRVRFTSYGRCERHRKLSRCQDILGKLISGCTCVEDLPFVCVQGLVSDLVTKKIQQHLIHDAIQDRTSSNFERCGSTNGKCCPMAPCGALIAPRVPADSGRPLRNC